MPPKATFSVGGKVPKPLQAAINRGKQRAIFDKPTFDAMSAQAKTDAFTVAGDLTNDAISSILNSAMTAIQAGRGWNAFKQSVPPGMFERIAAPEVVLQNAGANTYQRARYEQQQRLKALRPFLQYLTFGDDRVRPNHAILNRTIAPQDSDFWKINYPPNGHRCRCVARALRASTVKANNWTVYNSQAAVENALIKKQLDAGIPMSKAIRPIADQGWRGTFVINQGVAEQILQAFKYFPVNKYKSLITPDKKPAGTVKEFTKKAKTTVDPPPIMKPVEKTADEIIDTAKTLDIKDFKKIGGQKGSNLGGLYEHKTTGEKYYIKQMDLDHAWNEVLSGKLYRLAGVETPEINFIKIGKGKNGVVSKYVEGLRNDSALLKGVKVQGVADGYGADCWLANWDTVGLGYDNMLVIGHGKTARVVRIDPGGALKYRAQGSKKGAAFGQTVTETKTLTDASVNAQSASVFKNYSKAELDASLEKIVKIKDDDIRKVISKFGPGGKEKNVELANKMIKRKQDIADQLGIKIEKGKIISPKKKKIPKPVEPVPEPVSKAVAPEPVPERITPQQAKQITKSRSNGISLPRDFDEIEDQSIPFWEAIEGGKPVTNATFKARGNAINKLKAIATQGQAPPPSIDVDDKILTAVKGIKKQISEGVKELRPVDIERIDAAIKEYEIAIKKIQLYKGYDKKVLDNFEKHYEPWIQELKTTKTIHNAKGPPRFDKKESFASYEMPAPKFPKTDKSLSEFSFKETAAEHQAATIEKGRSILGNETISGGYGKKYVASTDKLKIELYLDQSQFANYGKVVIKAKGAADDVANDIIDIVNRAGINAKAPTSLDTEELYLRKIFYYLDTKGSTDTFKTVDKIKDQAKRIQELKYRIELNPKYKGKGPVDKLRGYNPNGKYQAFGEGRKVWEIPDDALGTDWAKFQDDYVLTHRVYGGDIVQSIDRILESGGQLISTTDKLRRGIPMGGMSPAEDLRTGGADYVFTRIARKKDALQQAKTITWKSKKLKQLDAISYRGDLYGKTSQGAVAKYRQTGVDDWKSAAINGGNETILKSSLSLLEDVVSINVRDSMELKKIIDVFKKHGYPKYPDGRKFEDVIKIIR